MKKSKVIFLLITLQFFASLAYADEIKLKLKEPIDGQKYLVGEKVDLNRSEVVLKIEGETVSVKRDDIDTITFLSKPRPATQSTSSTTSSKQQNPKLQSHQSADKTKDPDPRELNSTENRAQFRAIQTQMMEQYKGRPGYDKAIRQQQEMYEALASGRMSVDELKAEADAVSGKAKGYNANETKDYPELELLLKQLDAFSTE